MRPPKVTPKPEANPKVRGKSFPTRAGARAKAPKVSENQKQLRTARGLLEWAHRAQRATRGSGNKTVSESALRWIQRKIKGRKRSPIAKLMKGSRNSIPLMKGPGAKNRVFMIITI
jgi:hypothetical protein